MMVSTDVFGRGIDIERVNIVINYDMPDNSDQYLHRVGRAGRFGTKGLTISFISTTEDEEVLADTQRRFEVKIEDMPNQIDSSTYMNQWNSEWLLTTAFANFVIMSIEQVASWECACHHLEWLIISKLK